jgi:hypothetical protein
MVSVRTKTGFNNPKEEKTNIRIRNVIINTPTTRSDVIRTTYHFCPNRYLLKRDKRELYILAS